MSCCLEASCDRLVFCRNYHHIKEGVQQVQRFDNRMGAPNHHSLYMECLDRLVDQQREMNGTKQL
eukprot:6491616-Amphidinium_carterae.1